MFFLIVSRHISVKHTYAPLSLSLSLSLSDDYKRFTNNKSNESVIWSNNLLIRPNESFIRSND